MEHNVVNTVVEGLLTGGIAVIAYFLKRTIAELDECKSKVQQSVQRSELDECKKDIAQVRADYITREDFFREQDNTRRQLDRIMNILLEIKGEG